MYIFKAYTSRILYIYIYVVRDFDKDNTFTLIKIWLMFNVLEKMWAYYASHIDHALVSYSSNIQM